jgi:hypothetical protein
VCFIRKAYLLVLCRPAVALYCDNYTEHLNTLYEKNTVFWGALPFVTCDIQLSQTPPSYCSITGYCGGDGDTDGDGTSLVSALV